MIKYTFTDILIRKIAYVLFCRDPPSPLYAIVRFCGTPSPTYCVRTFYTKSPINSFIRLYFPISPIFYMYIQIKKPILHYCTLLQYLSYWYSFFFFRKSLPPYHGVFLLRRCPPPQRQILEKVPPGGIWRARIERLINDLVI